MRWTIVVICGIVAVLATQVSALFFPIVASTGTTAAATTTTLTVGTGGLALGGLAIAGIIGLGLAAVLLSGGEEEPSYGYHAPAPSYHAPKPSYHAPEPSYHEPEPSYQAPSHHGRRKRSSHLDRKAAELFAMVAQVDSLGCGMRLVCQVFQKRLEDLTPRERAIKRFIGEKPVPVPAHKVNEPKARYVSAAILGIRNNDCYKIYEACPLTEDDVKAYLINLDNNLVGDL